MDSGGHILLVGGGRVGGEAAVQEGILKLTERFLSIKVRATHHIICRLDNYIITAAEVMKGDRFIPGDVGSVRSLFEIESIDQCIAVVPEQDQAAEIAWRRRPV